jgi:glycosyltransferase involved in cell wall biosynthesis
MTVNELIAEVLETRNRPRSPVCSVYNIPVQVLKQNRNRRLRKRGKAIVLYQGRYAPERGLESLVESSEYLRRDIQLVFRGYGDIEDELRTLAKGRRNVRFDEPVAMDEMVDAAQNADVGIVSYLPTNINNYLASPNKLFEYIQAGLPIAASESPLMRKIVLANRIGVLFDPADPRTIAAALNEITRKKELDRYRRNVASVAEKYSWPVESRKLLQVYAELMKEFE